MLERRSSFWGPVTCEFLQYKLWLLIVSQRTLSELHIDLFHLASGGHAELQSTTKKKGKLIDADRIDHTVWTKCWIIILFCSSGCVCSVNITDILNVFCRYRMVYSKHFSFLIVCSFSFVMGTGRSSYCEHMPPCRDY